MNQRTLILVLIFLMTLGSLTNILAQSKFEALRGSAKDIAIDYTTQDVYVIGATSHDIFKWNEKAKSWRIHVKTSFKPLELVVTRGGYIWTVDANRVIRCYDTNKWITLPGKAIDLATDIQGNLWMIDVKKQLHVWSGGQSKWIKFKTSGIDKVAPTSRQYRWEVRKGEAVSNGYLYSAGKTKLFNVSEIALDQGTKQVYAISNGILKVHAMGSRGFITRQNGDRTRYKKVDVMNKKIWLVGENNRIYRIIPDFQVKSNQSIYEIHFLGIRNENPYKDDENNVPLTMRSIDKQIYGRIGLRVYLKTPSVQNEIKNFTNSSPVVFDRGRNNPIASTLGSLYIPNYRQFVINKNLINDTNVIKFNVQTNLNEYDSKFGDDKLGWKQKNIYLRQSKPGEIYSVNSKKGDNDINVLFTIVKIQ